MKSKNISKLLLRCFGGQVRLYRYSANLRACYTHGQTIELFLDYFKSKML